MRKVIFQKFILILALALIISGSIFSITTSKSLLDKTREEMMSNLRIADYALDYDGNLKYQLDQLKALSNNRSIRYTIIDLEGNVYADSDVTSAYLMEDHSEREEYREALSRGVGYARRKSSTLKESMLYVAILASNGKYVLRNSLPFSGMIEYTEMLLPALLIGIGITLIISVILAQRFSASITKPLQEIAEEITKLKEKEPELHFDRYQYEEMNMIAETIMRMSQAVKESIDQIELEKRIRQEFFSNASHELKTPLTSIRGYIELLENGLAANEDTKKDFMSRIKKETDNMTHLINDILMISQLEMKEVEVVLSEVRLCPLVEEVCCTLKPLADELSVSIETNCRPLVIWANVEQMRELLNNLIINAIKYNKPGGHVYVTVTSELDQIVITVEDTGVGIPEESKHRIFERFYRVDKGRSRKLGGTGLGLSIVKHVANYYNGTIQLESQPGEGSKFTIRLSSLMKQGSKYYRSR